MSTANIISVVPTEAGIVVTFQTKDGGSRAYLYEGTAAEAILRGADPAGYRGERIK